MNSIYVMAHRCNTKGWLDHAIKWQANGIEVDITKDGGKLYSWHGDSGGWEELATYLDHACMALQEGNGLKVALMIFDLKYDRKDKIKAADIDCIRTEVRTRLLDPINAGLSPDDLGGLYAFYGVYRGDAYAGEFECSMKNTALDRHEGVNYDANREVGPEVALEWKDTNGIDNFFYSSGIFVGGASATMWKQLKAAGALRPSREFGVYGWTFGYGSSAASTLKNYYVDGVLGNMDQKYGWVPSSFDSYELQRFCLATRDGTPPFRTTLSTAAR